MLIISHASRAFTFLVLQVTIAGWSGMLAHLKDLCLSESQHYDASKLGQSDARCDRCAHLDECCLGSSDSAAVTDTEAVQDVSAELNSYAERHGKIHQRYCKIRDNTIIVGVTYSLASRGQSVPPSKSTN